MEDDIYLKWDQYKWKMIYIYLKWDSIRVSSSQQSKFLYLVNLLLAPECHEFSCLLNCSLA